MTVSGEDGMRIEIIFDVVCPWCYIGKRRLERALALRPLVRLKPGWRCFLLNPEMPPGGIDRDAYLVKKFGSESRVRRIFGAIHDAGQTVEIDFNFEDIRHTPNTVNAHRLVHFAERADRAGDMVEALFFEYFVNGKDIGDIATLVALGRNLGLDAGRLDTYLRGDEDLALVYEENARAHRLGINGVPSIVFNGQLVIAGAQEPEVLARVLDAAREVGAAT